MDVGRKEFFIFNFSQEPFTGIEVIVELQRQRLVNWVVSRSNPYLDNWVIRNAFFLSVILRRTFAQQRDLRHEQSYVPNCSHRRIDAGQIVEFYLTLNK